MLKIYQVILRPIDDTEPGALQFLSWGAPEAYATFDYTDDDGNEVHSVEINEAKANWFELQLDQADGVVSYKEIG